MTGSTVIEAGLSLKKYGNIAHLNSIGVGGMGCNNKTLDLNAEKNYIRLQLYGGGVKTLPKFPTQYHPTPMCMSIVYIYIYIYKQHLLLIEYA